MDDDCKDYRKSKPQQKLYKPGSGPLRRSRYGLDARMESYDVDSDLRGKEKSYYGSVNSVNGEAELYKESNNASNRYRKPGIQLYQARAGDSERGDNSSQCNNRQIKNRHDNHNYSGSTGSYNRGASKTETQYKDGQCKDINYNKQVKKGSDSKPSSPLRNNREFNTLERNRDSRSMETWTSRHKPSTGGKPPSGRRNSAGYTNETRQKHIVDLDNIPPRFRKKYLEQAGHHSIESIDQFNKGINDLTQACNKGQSYTSSSWSQTLPSRGRGRLRDNESFDREKFINSYLNNFQVQSSHKPTLSTSYTNLYEPNDFMYKGGSSQSGIESQKDPYEIASKNGVISHNDNTQDLEINSEIESEHPKDNEPITSTLSDMTNLDWTEEVEKNINLDEISEPSTSFSKTSIQEPKSTEAKESKRKSRHRNKRSSSKGHRNSDKKERSRKDSTVSVQYEPEHHRRDSNASVHLHDLNGQGLRHYERERRDSHRSNRSSTIGNSRDDLDRWRSLRSYSREQSTERKIVSQCNSRGTSVNRALSPRDSEGFRVPSNKSGNWQLNNQKRNDSSWTNRRMSSIERRRASPTPSTTSVEPMSESLDMNTSMSSGRRNRKKGGKRRGRNSENVQPSPIPPGSTPAPTNTNWREEIIEAKKHQVADRLTDNSQRKRLNSVMSDKSTSDVSAPQPGLLVLPQGSTTHAHKEQHSRVCAAENQKILFDHHNPSKPIVVHTSSKPDIRMERGLKDSSLRNGPSYECVDIVEGSEAGRGARHVALLQQVDRADAILKTQALRPPLALAGSWHEVAETRKFLQSALQRLLMSDLKYCQADNIEQQFWKILYYHFIETLRKHVTQVLPEEKTEIVKLINTIINEGNIFYENLIQLLEKTYKFNTEDYLNDNHVFPPKGLGYVGLAMISVQKLYVCLGDLARYKEQVNETNNYAKSKFWYTKAQQINPKNGRPYNQLAILAIYARRKLDAVYYYMRSLMSSNPLQSARESLLSLFEENRKKYEAAERKRRVVLESKNECKEESENGSRREVWIRPGTQRPAPDARVTQEDFDAMSPVELNKNFITAYLHVHGKLVTKIGMESFDESATQMLAQFRALLNRQPLPTPAARLLQLTALNMFAVETTTSKGKSGEHERSAWLECALGVALMMFGALLERCCALLPEPTHSQQHTDALSLLPAIKVWSDWMLCHSSVWNPPPSFDNFRIENGMKPWDWLAKLMNILESLDEKTIKLKGEHKEGFVPVRLAEDSTLAGFTPLMYMEPAVAWAGSESPLNHHAAEHALRTRKLLFFGTEYLVGVEPPVLKLEYPVGFQPRYVSAVQKTNSDYPPLQQLIENSEDELNTSGATSGPTSNSEGIDVEGTDEVTKRLLRRKEQLESRKATLEKRRQRMQEMVGSGNISLELEVRPRWLVPDTNCFIDHLDLLRTLSSPNHPYNIAVPLIVICELEGLCRCTRLGEASRNAITWVSGAGARVRLVTARGSLLASRTFTAENHRSGHSNDDRVLDTAINLQANLSTEQDTKEECVDGKIRRVCEVVLLTDDRNLRVKALAAELPARDLPSFMQWAGVSVACDQQKTEVQPSNAPEDTK